MSVQKAWGHALALVDRSRRIGWVDFLVAIGLAGVLFGLVDLAHQWTGEPD